MLAARVGPWALAQGRVRTGLGALQMARRPGTRGVFVLLVVAVASLVAAADVWQVAAANRTARAGVEVGAPAVLQVRADRLGQVTSAAAQLDPSGRRVVPTAEVVPPNVGVSILAIRPAGAAAVAAWGWPQDRPTAAELARLDPPLPAPIRLTGGSVDVRLGAVLVRGDHPPNLFLDLVGSDGAPASYDLGLLPARGRDLSLRRPLPCAQGCRLQGFTLFGNLLDSSPKVVSIDLSAITMHAGADPTAGDGTPVPLGAASGWRGSTALVATPDDLSLLDQSVASTTALPDPPGYPVADVSAGPGSGPAAGLTLRFLTAGDRIAVVHGDVPVRIPALGASFPEIPGQSSASFLGRPAGRADPGVRECRAPAGGSGPVRRVRRGRPGPAQPALRRVEHDHVVRRVAGRRVGRQHPPAERRPGGQGGRRDRSAHGGRPGPASLHDSGAVWSLRLGLAAGLAGVLVAMAVLVIGVITTLRSRRYDVAALRLSGVTGPDTSGATLGEQLALSVVGSVVGAVCGVAGARLLFRAAPYLAGGDGFTGSRVYTAWLLAVLAWLGGLALLVAVSLAGAREVTRGASPAVVRDGAT